MRFSSEQAMEASEAGEPIMIEREAARKLWEGHGLTDGLIPGWSGVAYGFDSWWSDRSECDAWELLLELGY